MATEVEDGSPDGRALEQSESLEIVSVHDQPAHQCSLISLQIDAVSAAT